MVDAHFGAVVLRVSVDRTDFDEPFLGPRGDGPVCVNGSAANMVRDRHGLVWLEKVPELPRCIAFVIDGAEHRAVAIAEVDIPMAVRPVRPFIAEEGHEPATLISVVRRLPDALPRAAFDPNGPMIDMVGQGRNV